MTYVMVPVPEDRVEDVMQYVVRLLTQAAMEEWDEGSIAELFENIDEPSRALLSTVATSTLEGERVTVDAATSAIELSWRETMGLLRELNDFAREEARPMLLTRRTVTEALPNGRTREVRILTMNDDIARMVHDADRAFLLGSDDPLGGEDP